MTEDPLTVLTSEPESTSRLTAAGMVVAGRRRVRRRRAASALTAAAVVLAMTAGIAAATKQRRPAPEPGKPVPAPTGCTVTRLPGTARPMMLALDPSGVHTAADAGSDVVTWSVGGEEHSVAVGGGANVTVGAVNASGVVVGWLQRNGHDVPYAIQGRVRELALPSGATGARANGVNAAGDVVGEATLAGGAVRAVLWRHGSAAPAELLPTPASRRSAAYDIGDDGRVVGALDDGAAPYLWQPDGTGSALPTPPGRPGGIATRITGDWVDGPVDYLATTVADSVSGRRSGVAAPIWARWNLRTGTVEVVDLDPISGGAGVTTTGAVLVNTGFGPVLWRPDGVTDLPRPHGFGTVQSTAVSADGAVIVGWATPSSGGSNVPFRWWC
ncbi:hypothetical protein ABZS66_41920 [Dactylosporangium sp. NPDC005572]|uniref:hypothetical protein n=1 Tax=Dactylosporangium sp. NPDC005572 TaxID=3156889 RepID=UPI0033AA1C40